MGGGLAKTKNLTMALQGSLAWWHSRYSESDNSWKRKKKEKEKRNGCGDAKVGLTVGTTHHRNTVIDEGRQFPTPAWALKENCLSGRQAEAGVANAQGNQCKQLARDSFSCPCAYGCGLPYCAFNSTNKPPCRSSHPPRLHVGCCKQNSEGGRQPAK